jgi:NAD(P)-dependent dehydrogenase (short-subunit alcohol dehydrogenase family)
MTADGILLITGGARGIGAATALLAAERGWAVAIGYRQRDDAADALVQRIRATGGRAAAVRGDVTLAQEVEDLFDQTDLAFPDRILRGVVASAGIGGGHGPVADTPPDVLGLQITTNALGTILTVREAVRRLSTARGGRGGSIVAVSSMAATIGGRPGSVVYAASKAAVDTLTVGLAKEVAPQGIRVNAVRPGMTRTDMTSAVTSDPVRHAAIAATIPIQRIAEPEEIARPIVWLLSDEASFVSGTLLDVSGGGFLIGAPLVAAASQA